jgi:hypothetical protein
MQRFRRRGRDADAATADAATADAATASGPPASAGHDLVYHDGLGLVLLVNAGLGGASQPPSTERSQLWAWDGERWSVLDESGPPVRNLAGVAYDAGRDVLVIHGGTYSAELSYDETWEWSQGGGWQELDMPGPGVRDHTQMTYDVVLHGGYDPDAGDRGDTWSWNGTAWTELTPERAPRTHARMAFDEGLDGLVVVGGASAGEPALVRRDDGWLALEAAGPAPRYLPGLTYDRRRHRLVLFGGGDPSSSALLADTWEFDGAEWQQRGP